MGCSQTKQEDLKRAERTRPDRQRIVAAEQPDAVMNYKDAPTSTASTHPKPSSQTGKQNATPGSPQAASATKKIGPKVFKGAELGSDLFKDQSVTERNMVEVENFQERIRQKESNIVESTSSAMFDLSINPGDIDPIQVAERERFYEEYVCNLTLKFGPMPSILVKDHNIVPTMTPSDFQLITTSCATLSKTFGLMNVQNSEAIVVPFPALPVKN